MNDITNAQMLADTFTNAMVQVRTATGTEREQHLAAAREAAHEAARLGIHKHVDVLIRKAQEERFAKATA